MKKSSIAATLALGLSLSAFAGIKIPGSAEEDKDKVMSDAYWALWNPEVQAKIDRDIEANRKADAEVKLDGAAEGTPVKVEQLTHDFIFGAHIFNFDQLGDKTLNNKYKDQFGTLFNSATVAFYWLNFELNPGRKRFNSEYWDSQEFWENCPDPEYQAHWRRPAPEAVIKFCKERGVRVHGHTLIWCSRLAFPTWLLADCAKGEEKKALDTLIETYAKFESPYAKPSKEVYTKKYKDMKPEEIEELLPNFTKELKRRFNERIIEMAQKYGDTIESWDIVNESAADYKKGLLIPGNGIAKSRAGIMVGDYTYESFKTAEKYFPECVKLNINDYIIDDTYPKQVKELLSRGCKIDIVGSQMHLFKPKQTIDISEGKNIQTPNETWETLKRLDVGLPIHMSEITVTAPDETERGRMMQAIIARNLYRIWFSIKPVMGITWWNSVDGCGYIGEPVLSGLFTRNMQPKPLYYALNGLINGEWKTNLDVKAGKDGEVKFRGFKGKYVLSWKDSGGNLRRKYVHVK